MAAELRADMPAQPVLGRLQRRRAAPRVGRPDRPPLVGPVVELLPCPAGIDPGALELGRLLADEPPLGVVLAGEAAAVELAVRPPVAGAVALGSVWAVLDRGHCSCTPTLRGTRHRRRLDGARGDEGVQVAGGDADVPAELGVRDAPLEDEPAHEPQRGAQLVGGFLWAQELVHGHLPSASEWAGWPSAGRLPFGWPGRAGSAVNSASSRCPYRSLTPAARARPAPVGVWPAWIWAS